MDACAVYTCVYNPMTSTQSPSSSSATAIGLAGSSFSPSMSSCGPALPVDLPVGPCLLSSPADLRKALTIAPHVVVGRTVNVIVAWAERSVSLNFSPPPDADSASDSASALGSADRLASRACGLGAAGGSWCCVRRYSCVILLQASAYKNTGGELGRMMDGMLLERQTDRVLPLPKF
jgi:hypothetical protein